MKETTQTIGTEEEYVKHLRQFFHDGRALRTDVIEAALPVLRELLGV
jgi:hypothetical protein